MRQRIGSTMTKRPDEYASDSDSDSDAPMPVRSDCRVRAQ
jgi:hypothetical protein